MNSVQQTIIGLVLVGIAFVFGSYLHRDDNSGVEQAKNSEPQNLAWQADGSTSSAPMDSMPRLRPSVSSDFGETPSSSMPSVQKPKLEEANLVPRLETPSQPEMTLKSRRIAAPDFSRFSYESDDVAPPVPQPKSDEATQNFASHFPNELDAVVDSVPPVRPIPEETVHYESSPSNLQLQKPTIDSMSILNNALENQVAVQPRITIPPRAPAETYRMKTQTNVVAVRPKERSPVMMNATRFATHRSVEGETLQDLALKYFGDRDYYLDIYVANQNVLDNPAILPAGIDLRIPIYD